MSDPRPDFDPENVLTTPDMFDADAPESVVVSAPVQKLVRRLYRAAKLVLETSEASLDHPGFVLSRAGAINNLSRAVHAIALYRADLTANDQ